MPMAVDDVLDRLSGLPPFPKVTTRLLSMLEDDGVAAQDIAQVISTDPSLVLKSLHLANSPFYMVSKPIETVMEAVLVLGINTIKSITTAAAIQKGLAAVKPRADAFDMLGFWRHSYATAIAASKLATGRQKGVADTLYVAGLIHDIGEVILAYYWPEVWLGIVNSFRASTEPLEEIEMRLFHRTHKDIGAQLCRNWLFPDKIVELIERHNDTPDPSTPEHLRMLHQAHLLVTQCGFGFPLCRQTEPSCEEESEEYKSIVETLPGDVDYQLRVLEG